MPKMACNESKDCSIRNLFILRCFLLLLALGAPWGGAPAQRIEPKKDAWRFLEEDVGAWLEKAETASRKGDMREAVACYLTYLRRNARDALALYNLACCYAQLSDADAAAALLLRAVDAGFADVEHLRKDPDFDPVRRSAAFQAAERRAAAFVEATGALMYVEAPRMMRCRYRLPAGFDPQKACPLVIGLHGNGGTAEFFLPVLSPEAFPGMICAAPEGPYPRWDLAVLPGRPGSWFLEGSNSSLWPRLDPPTAAYVLNVIDAFSRQFKISSVYLLGFSQGVGAAFFTAIRNPGRVGGVLAFSGRFPREILTESEVANAKTLGIFWAQGRNDLAIDPGKARESREWLKAQGYAIEYREFDGGHLMPPDLVRQAGDWIRNRLKTGGKK
ncbi:MAG: hypothetical protein KA419_18085 [Acidobacteria bacterium]|nr:hypothetical protein [Acidobacteriota bacterium]